MTQVAPPEGEDLCAGAGTACWKSFNRDLKAKGITAGSCDEPGGGTSVFVLARSLGLLRQWSGGVLCSSRDKGCDGLEITAVPGNGQVGVGPSPPPKRWWDQQPNRSASALNMGNRQEELEAAEPQGSCTVAAIRQQDARTTAVVCWAVKLFRV